MWTCTDFALHACGILWTHGAVSCMDVCGCESSYIQSNLTIREGYIVTIPHSVCWHIGEIGMFLHPALSRPPIKLFRL